MRGGSFRISSDSACRTSIARRSSRRRRGACMATTSSIRRKSIRRSGASTTCARSPAICTSAAWGFCSTSFRTTWVSGRTIPTGRRCSPTASTLVMLAGSTWTGRPGATRSCCPCSATSSMRCWRGGRSHSTSKRRRRGCATTRARGRSIRRRCRKSCSSPGSIQRR